MTLSKHDTIRIAAEQDLAFFGTLVHPQSVFGNIHFEVMQWITREHAKTHQIILLPRDHRKSYIAALYAAWQITRNPAITILYISSTANLATKQLKLIKDILTSDIYRFYWPEMVHPDEAKREKWTESEIAVDHPTRKREVVRDPTVFTAGLTTNIVGLHCNLAILDDVVTDQNSLTEEGREKVMQQYSLLASIETTGARELVVGTRYDPNDLYGHMLSKKILTYSENGELVKEEELYEDFTRQVESIGDGTGEFLWPRQQRKDGRWFGFDPSILSVKKAQYSDQRLFRAQYYNDPNSAEGYGIPKEQFQYYDRSFITQDPISRNWYFKTEKLNIFAAIDFSYVTTKHSDYTAIVVVGVDRNLNYYVLEIDRFKVGTNPISEYFDHLLRLHQKWNFQKLRAESTAAQSVIVKDLKVNYIRKLGLSLSIEEYPPTRDKESRILAVLQPKYANGQIWHYMGGLCQVLEEELTSANPSHDDVKDALASAIDISLAPAIRLYNSMKYKLFHHPKFGGISWNRRN